MKLRYFLFLFSFLLTAGCSKKDIIIENTVNTPDLSNPVIQKISNQIWYKNPQISSESARLIWETKENVPSISESLASVLYSLALDNFTLNRDGTSDMLFVPPFFTNVYILLKGSWQVQEREENAIVLNTPTPVSNITAKVKVLNLESKDQVSALDLSMDFGNRLMEFTFENSPYASFAGLDYGDFRWIEEQEISTTPLEVQDYIGAWASANYDGALNTFMAPPDIYEEEDIIRVTQIEDLLMNTPTFTSGQAFDLRPNGKATIVYNLFSDPNDQGNEDSPLKGKRLASDATWQVKGNKIFIETDEAFFYSFGEALFGMPVYAEHLTTVGYIEGFPIRIQKNRFYAIELIKKTDKGFWSRVTTNRTVFYAFLSKVQVDLEDTVNIKTAF